MKKNRVFLMAVILMGIPACAPQENKRQKRADRTINKAHETLGMIDTEFSSAIALLSIKNKQDKKNKLKKVILQTTKKWWKNSSIFRVSWLNFTTSLSDYKDIPFHAFDYAIQNKVKVLSMLLKKLNNSSEDTAHLKEQLLDTRNNLKKLHKLIVKQNRYLQEEDKICLSKKLNWQNMNAAIRRL